MTEKHLKACRIVVGLAFVFNFLYAIFYAIFNAVLYNIGIEIKTILELGSVLLMAVSMFTGIYLLVAVGAGMQCIQYLLHLFQMRHFNFMYAGFCLLYLLAYILVIILILKKERAFTLSIAAAVCITVGRILFICFGSGNQLQHLHLYVNQVRVEFLSVCLPILLVGLIVASVPMTEPKKLAIGNSHSGSSDNHVEN